VIQIKIRKNNRKDGEAQNLQVRKMFLFPCVFAPQRQNNSFASAEEITAEIERRRACGRYFSASLRVSGKNNF